jgi:hypothetical protein
MAFRGITVEDLGEVSLGAVSAERENFSLVEDLSDPVMAPALSPQRYIDLMKLDITSFAQNAHVHRNTVTRAPAAASVQKHLRENLMVLRAAFDAAGGDIAKAKQWFRNEPLAPFNYRTAEDLVADGRAEDVIRLLESYNAGAAG